MPTSFWGWRMAELTVAHLRDLLGKQSNRAAAAERQVRDLTAENARLRRVIAGLKSLTREVA